MDLYIKSMKAKKGNILDFANYFITMIPRHFLFLTYCMLSLYLTRYYRVYIHYIYNNIPCDVLKRLVNQACTQYIRNAAGIHRVYYTYIYKSVFWISIHTFPAYLLCISMSVYSLPPVQTVLPVLGTTFRPV
jgi:hypothetical protein